MKSIKPKPPLGRLDNGIREMRLRLGWTQWDLAEYMHVDQGTVSRWERGIEQPRPAANGRLRDLLTKGANQQALARQLAVVRNDLLPSVIVDGSFRLKEVSRSAIRHYQVRRNLDLSDHVGWTFERHLHKVGNPEVWSAVEKAGPGRENILLMRLTINARGMGHTTHFEPIWDSGVLSGWLSFRVSTFKFEENSRISMERLDACYADQPERMVPIFVGETQVDTPPK